MCCWCNRSHSLPCWRSSRGICFVSGWWVKRWSTRWRRSVCPFNMEEHLLSLKGQRLQTLGSIVTVKEILQLSSGTLSSKWAQFRLLTHKFVDVFQHHLAYYFISSLYSCCLFPLRSANPVIKIISHNRSKNVKETSSVYSLWAIKRIISHKETGDVTCFQFAPPVCSAIILEEIHHSRDRGTNFTTNSGVDRPQCNAATRYIVWLSDTRIQSRYVWPCAKRENNLPLKEQ